MSRFYFRPVKPETINNALHHLRMAILRDGGEGLEHVDALLRLRGIDPMGLPVPRKIIKSFAKGELRRAILDALRDGPLTGRQIAECVREGRPDLTAERAYKRVYVGLDKLQKAGLVTNERRLWGLALRGQTLVATDD